MYSGKIKNFFIILISFLVLGISFKVMVLVEGLTEVRPVNAIPPIAGLLCGPLGGIACAVGNLIADMAGTFSSNSILGVVGNFMSAYLPYRLWHLFLKESPNLHSRKNIAAYCLICAAGAMTAAWILSFGLYIFWGIWMEQIYTYVFFNNLGFSIGIGMPILIILTSDSIGMEAAPPPGKSVILETSLSKKTAAAVYTVIMLSLCITVTAGHTGPDHAQWMLPVSAAAAAVLLNLLV